MLKSNWNRTAGSRQKGTHREDRKKSHFQSQQMLRHVRADLEGAALLPGRGGKEGSLLSVL